jgi:hypothetical protein
VMKLVEILLMLTHFARRFDKQSACCAGVEALVWSKRYPALEAYSINALRSTDLWSICPPEYEGMASSVTFSSEVDNGLKTMQCNRLGLLVNSEDIIGSFSLKQYELFGKKSKKHAYHTTASIQEAEALLEKFHAAAIQDQSEEEEEDESPNPFLLHCSTCPPNIVLYDLDFYPLSRFSPEQWIYVDDSIDETVVQVEDASGASGADGSISRQVSLSGQRSMVEWNEDGKVAYHHLQRTGLNLEFAEMFHSCVPTNDGIFLSSGEHTELMCVWRRHVQLFHMVF